jgi:ribonuclease BN (tRNA processing enzyme)
MDVTFLGTNGWYDTLTGNTCSVLIRTEEADIILDAGNGIAKTDRYISQEKPVFLFISHYHIDHIAGLHTLAKFRFRKGLTICGQEGIQDALSSVIREPYSVPFDDLPYPVRFIELPGGTNQIPFPIECRQLIHPVPCYGYRLTLGGRTVTFCTDTGICDNAILLARDSDLLITECGLRPGEKSPDWPHLSPEDAIMIAKSARAGRLALIHFAAHLYTTLGQRKDIEERYRPECPGLLSAVDDMTITI